MTLHPSPIEKSPVRTSLSFVHDFCKTEKYTNLCKTEGRLGKYFVNIYITCSGNKTVDSVSYLSSRIAKNNENFTMNQHSFLIVKAQNVLFVIEYCSVWANVHQVNMETSRADFFLFLFTLTLKVKHFYGVWGHSILWIY